jgi:Peptidase A4 family
VEQTGTDSDCVGTTPNYYAWYEFYPRASFEILTVPVKPGDSISALVYYDSSNKDFYIQITDETTGKSYTKGSTVSGAVRSSAEWIAEAPCCTNSGGILPLSDFGTITFGGDSTGVPYSNWAKDTSATAPIGGYPAVNTILIDKTASSTSPQTVGCSTLSSDGSTFSCTWAQ